MAKTLNKLCRPRVHRSDFYYTVDVYFCLQINCKIIATKFFSVKPFDYIYTVIKAQTQMNKDAKYGILFIALLFIVVPVVFLLIQLSVGLLGFLFNYPGYCLTAIVGLFAGSILTKLSK